jgi:hypothetical protein
MSVTWIAMGEKLLPVRDHLASAGIQIFHP